LQLNDISAIKYLFTQISYDLFNSAIKAGKIIVFDKK